MGEENVYMAKLAEQAERYEEMVEYMKKVAMASATDLSLEERNLLSVAYKNVVGARRASLRIIGSIENKEASKADGGKSNLIGSYKSKVESELNTICQDILGLLDSSLIKDSLESEPKVPHPPHAPHPPHPPHTLHPVRCQSPHLPALPHRPPLRPLRQVFYQKMKADYYRYLAEFATGDSKKDHAKSASDSYKAASDAATGLAPTHPIRLGLALNFSVFLYEVQQEQSEACTLAKSAFDDAIAELDTLDEESYKDSTLIMQLLRDNLTLWTSENDDQ